MLREWVYYQEGNNGTVHRVNDTGQDERFDFMDIPEDNFDTVDWTISPDGTRIVWNLFTFEAEDNEITLTSDLYIATIATGETRLLINYVVHEHQKLIPLRFSPDGSQVFVYLEPYGIGGLFAVYGEFSVLDIATGQLTSLPDPKKGGVAALSDDGTRLARIDYTEGEGFQVNLTDLTSGQTTEITTPSTNLGFWQYGKGVFSPDNSTLIYTVAYGDWGSEGFALVEVDFTTGTQQEILASQPNHYKVAHFEEGGSLLLTIAWPEESGGTFRLHPDGTLEQLSELTFVGISQ
jgi:Tol biopolymer transport system component